MASTSYAAPPPTLLAQLAQPSAAYKRRVWLAAASLAGFVTLYFLLAAWFLYTAYRLTVGADSTRRRVRRCRLSARLGARAPAPWRRGAKRLLFASERPYFK